MVLIFEYIFQQISTLIVIIAVCIIIYYKWAFSYWQKRNAPFLPAHIPFGSIDVRLAKTMNVGFVLQVGYQTSKCFGYRHVGFFAVTIPKYLVVDPMIIKAILQQDFNNFTERGFYHNEKDDPLSANLFAVGGEKWRYLRTKLSPAFTSGKLKIMFENLLQCGYQLGDAINKAYENKHEIDIKDVSVCYTIDVIGSCAFGLECNSFKNPNSEFRREGKKAFDFTSGWRICKVVFAFVFPTLARQLKITLFDEKSQEFFINLVKETIKFRHTNNVIRNDMIQLLIELSKDKGKNETETGVNLFENKSIIKELAAQVFIFFAAGFETSSTTLTYCLYELAKNPEIQQKLRDEINSVLAKHEGRVTYDSIMDMKYMNQVVDETLRKYPPVSFITRVCVKDYKIPGTEVVLEKGIETVISILGLHHDPDYYPEAKKFDPERFSEENKKKRLPFTYLPFGEGPRTCIGLRFGLMQVKVALTVLLRQYRFYLNPKTVEPIEFEPCSFTLIPKGKILLDIEKIV